MCELCNAHAVYILEFLPDWHLGCFEESSEHFQKGEFYISRTASNEIAAAWMGKPVEEDHVDFHTVSYDMHESVYLRPMEGKDLVEKCLKAGWDPETTPHFCDFLCDFLAKEIKKFENKHGISLLGPVSKIVMDEVIARSNIIKANFK